MPAPNQVRRRVIKQKYKRTRRGRVRKHTKVSRKIPQILTYADNSTHENLLPVTMGSIQTLAMMDSGATISIISQNHLNKIHPRFYTKSKPKYKTIQGVGGMINNVHSCVTLTVSIDTLKIEHNFHVIQTHHDIIFGLDFLRKNKAILNFDKKTVSLSNHTFKLSSPSFRSCLVKTSEKSILPPNSENNITVSLSKRHNDTVYIEPTVSCIQSYPNLQWPCSVITPKDNITITRVINTSDETIIIPKGRKIAVAYRVLDSHISTVDTDVSHQDSNIINSDIPSSSSPTPIDFDLSQSDLTPDQKQHFTSFLNKNRNIFATSLSELGCSNLNVHTIDTGDANPVSQRFYRQSPKIREETERQIQDLLKQGLIEPSTSHWRSPIVMVRKKDNSYRFAVDYRKLNEVTKKMSFPLPRLQDVWDALGESNSCYYTVLDMASGFWQFMLDPETKHKSSFITPTGQYQWNRLPFGLSNSCVSFQMTMSQLFQPELYKSVLVYVDDILIFSRTLEEHMAHLETCFDRLRQANLTLKPNKCSFVTKSVNYLGHVISKDGILPNPDKTKVIDTFPAPKNQKEVRRLLGLTNYYKRFCKNYSTIVAPLNNLLKLDTEWDWSDECNNAFVTLKKFLTSPPLLSYPDTSKEFILTTDASLTAIGYILSQKDDMGRERVIEYGGRAIRKAEKSYTVTELECLAVLEGIKTYNVYLADAHFTVITDHKSLQFLRSIKRESGRLARWAMALQHYDFDVVYRKGIINKNADALSRRTFDDSESNEPDQKQDNIPPYIDILSYVGGTHTNDAVVNNVTHNDVHTNNTHLETVFIYDDNNECDKSLDPQVINIASLDAVPIEHKQKACPQIGPIFHYLETGELPDDNKKASQILLQADEYGLDDGVMYHLFYPRARGRPRPDRMLQQLVVPISLRDAVLSEYHDSLVGGGHQGFDRTYDAIKLKYYWPRMYTEIKTYVSSCDPCQRSKRHYHGKPAPLTPLPIVAPFQRWHLDFVDFKKTTKGCRHILTCVDSFSRWVEAFPIKSADAQTVASVLYKEIFSRYGAPHSIVTDRGQQFKSHLISALCEIFSVKRNFTSAYHPMSNSACERFHSYLKTSLRTYVKDDQSDWPDLLPGILMAYRMTPAMRSTEYSPYYLLFGIQPTLPLDTTLIPKPSLSAPHKVRLTSIIKNLQVARTIAKENIERNLSKNKTLYDRKAEAPDFTIGDLVLLFTPKVPIGHAAKLHRQWSGPWYIADMGPNNTYRLRHSVNHKESKSLIHANRLKHFHTPDDRIYHPTQDPQVPANDIDEEDADDRDLIHNTQNDDLGLRHILDDTVDDDAATDDNDNKDDNDTNDDNNDDNADHADNDNTDHNDDK